MGQAGIYENELKRILSGDPVILKKTTKTLSTTEKNNYMLMEKHPFFVVRSAASLGLADLVIMRRDLSAVIEVKARSNGTLLFSHGAGRVQEATVNMIRQCSRCGVLPIFAFRIKGVRGDSWRLFTLPISTLGNKEKQVNEFIPKLSVTNSHNFKMEWKNGMPLNEFLGSITKTGRRLPSHPHPL